MEELCHAIRNATACLSYLCKHLKNEVDRQEARLQIRKIEQALIKYESKNRTE